ncbi:MAG: hypothetical protein ACI4TM_09290 [Candidatus Cryptobacteroides sp.]
MKEGSQVIIGWAPDRVVRLEYLGNGSFEVKESLNSSLVAGDRFEQTCFMLSYPLYISRICRNGEYTPPYVAGINNGLNCLEVL